jgi:uncharacterized protein
VHDLTADCEATGRLRAVTSTIGTVAVLLVAGTLAGAVGAAGGITSLISYPALLAVGVPPLTANVANLVAGVACWPGSALTSRRELAGTRPWLTTRGLPVTVVGAILGAGLLLVTGPGVFTVVVPFLVVAGSLALLAQPALTARQRENAASTERGGHRATGLTLALLGLVSVYGGYFGAGSGVMVLATVLVLVDASLPRANAMKNTLVGATAVASALVFVVAGSIDWTIVAPLAIGLLAGSTVGPVVARRVPAWVIRWGAAGLGFVLAAELWLHPH